MLSVMCGRSTYKLTWEEIVALYRLTLDQPARNTQARYNVCPTTTIDTVIAQDGARKLVPMRWGLVPSWWSKPLKELKLATFNARAETVAEKPFFRRAFKRNRCLIPVSTSSTLQTALSILPIRAARRRRWRHTAAASLRSAGSKRRWQATSSRAL
jgi:hypothetical protein